MHHNSNYFAEIEEHFQKRRGAIRPLTRSDWSLIETWREAGIPLVAALRGIDTAFDKSELRQKSGRMGRINGLVWCTNAVMEAAVQLREASTGTALAATCARGTGFENERIVSHLESAAVALETSVIAHEVCVETGANLRELAQEVRASIKGTVNLETLERSLTVLEEKLFAGLVAAAPDDLLTALKESAHRELQPFRIRMDVVQIKQVESQFRAKQLLAHYNLPRFSLFYMDWK